MNKRNLTTPKGRRAAVGGFTLIELMVGVAIGLLATLVITRVLALAEGQRRSTTSGTDAQINGGLGIYAIQRQLKMAGYGLSTEGRALGCTLQARFKGGAAPASLPPTLAPVLITAGAASAPDSLRILSSSKTSYAVPAAIVGAYDPSEPARANRFQVSSAMSVQRNDLMALVYGVDMPCQIFQVTAEPSVSGQIDREDSGDWNMAKWPDAAVPASTSAFVVNLGALSDQTFTLTSDNKLRQTTRQLLSGASNSQDLQSNIVALRAYYGKDTDGDDTIDTFDKTTPTTNAGWLQVRAVRVALLARSAQFEKNEVTTSAPAWDVGTFAKVSGSVSCGSSKCVELAVDSSTDWKHYRYKVFDVLVPLRNQLWRSDFESGKVTTPPSTEEGTKP